MTAIRKYGVITMFTTMADTHKNKNLNKTGIEIGSFLKKQKLKQNSNQIGLKYFIDNVDIIGESIHNTSDRSFIKKPQRTSYKCVKKIIVQ